MILTPSQKLPKNVGDLSKIIVATGFEWLPKVQKIVNSGHTAGKPQAKDLWQKYYCSSSSTYFAINDCAVVNIVNNLQLLSISV